MLFSSLPCTFLIKRLQEPERRLQTKIQFRKQYSLHIPAERCQPDAGCRIIATLHSLGQQGLEALARNIGKAASSPRSRTPSARSSSPSSAARRLKAGEHVDAAIRT
jgi:hypothetical protein